MCDPVLTWNLVGMIAALVVIALVPFDLLLRYLNTSGQGLIPYQKILSPFFSSTTVTFQSVDEKARRNRL